MGILVIINAILLGFFISGLLSFLFGNNAFTRLLKVIIISIATIGYIYFLITPTSANIPMNLIILLMFAPIGLFLLLLIIRYIFKH